MISLRRSSFLLLLGTIEDKTKNGGMTRRLVVLSLLRSRVVIVKERRFRLFSQNVSKLVNVLIEGVLEG